MKILFQKNVAHWACARSKASINDSMGGTGVVGKLHHLVSDNYQRMWLVGMVEKLLMGGLPVLLHFPQYLLNEWICSEGLFPTKEDDILKQSQAFLSIRWLSSSSCSYSGPLTMEIAIFVKSHLKKWLISLPRGANQLLLSKSSNTRFTTRFTEFTEFATWSLERWWAGGAWQVASCSWIGEF